MAFLCTEQPGAEFTAARPVPDAARHCVELDIATSGDILTASIRPDALARDLAGLFRLGRPAYLAVAGSRGEVSAARVLTVDFLVPARS